MAVVTSFAFVSCGQSAEEREKEKKDSIENEKKMEDAADKTADSLANLLSTPEDTTKKDTVKPDPAPKK